MNEALPIETTRKLTNLRNLLDRISQISWSFSILNKQHPISEISSQDVGELIAAYNDLMKEASDVVQKWQN